MRYLVIFLGIAVLSAAGAAPARRPNILWFVGENLTHDLGSYGAKNVRTPHLDALAAQGVRFNACITPNLVCQPSRASMRTGLLPLTHGVWDNGVDLDPRVGDQGFAGTLARAGYSTAFFGKAHFATKATFAPTGTPARACTSAIALRDLVTSGFWPVSAVRSLTAPSIAFLSATASPTPMLIVMRVIFGTCIGFSRPRLFWSSATIFSRYNCCSLAI